MQILGNAALIKTSIPRVKMAREQDLRVECPEPTCSGGALVTVRDIEGRVVELPRDPMRQCDTCGRWMRVRAHFHLAAVPVEKPLIGEE